MKKNLLFFSLILIVTYSHAQNQKTNFTIGSEVSVPTFKEINSSGIGGGISAGYFLSKRIEGNISLSFNYFKGNVYDAFKNDTIDGFTVMPLLAGAKYFFTDKFYASGAAGILIGIRNAGNHFALSPGMGLLIPFSEKSKIDLGIRLIGVPTGYSFSENNFLNKGGYSFLSFRVAYVF